MPRQYGTLILSRYPILECRNTFLPSVRPGDPPVQREQRGLLKVTVNVRGVPLAFYNTHLEHTSTYQDVRAAQVDAIYQLVGIFTEPTILAGDLNARSHGTRTGTSLSAIPRRLGSWGRWRFWIHC
jgi:endonuclease/exonuclease/phosphatase family metal-dependent hydrolase